MKQRKRQNETVRSIGLCISFGGLLLAVASMEDAPITSGKLLLVLVCLALFCLFAYSLRHRPRKRSTAHLPQKRTVRDKITDVPDRVA